MGSIQQYIGTGRIVTVKTYKTAGTFTWSKPAGAKEIIIHLVGAGGGGGAGMSGASNITRYGGSGGGGGTFKLVHLTTNDLNITASVVVGAGGNGGTSGNEDSENGNATYVVLKSTIEYVNAIAYGGGGGTLGAVTIFGGGVSSIGRPAARNTGGAQLTTASGQTFDDCGISGKSANDYQNGDSGCGARVGLGGGGCWRGGAGGGTGAGCTSAVNAAGGEGGTFYSNIGGGGGAGGAEGTNNGSNGTAGNSLHGGSGAGGGGSNRTGTGGTGGIGGACGGGGGGGGGGVTAGAGGKGGCGYVMIITLS